VSNITSDILALCFDGLSSPEIDLKMRETDYGTHSLGWGLAWYPGDSNAAIVAKEPAAKDTAALKEAVSDWDNFRSTVFFCKVKGAAKGYTHHETQPFSRSFAGQHWLFMHNGDLDKVKLSKLHDNKSRFLEPLGRTDSELAFCYLLGKMQEGEARSLMDISNFALLSWFEELNALGSADMCISDGVTVACYYGTKSARALYYGRYQPPHEVTQFESDAAHLELNDPRDTYRTALIFCSSPFNAGNWVQMQPGQLILARRGSIVWNSKSNAQQHPVPASEILANVPPKMPHFHAMQAEQAQTAQSMPHQSIVSARSVTHTPEGRPLTFRVYDITHTTKYAYSEAVEHSTHVFRLQPVEDRLQEVVNATLTISSDGEETNYEDVFGNQSAHYSISKPYKELMVESKSRVKIYASPPDDHGLSQRQSVIPLAWMPWQRQMMMPYLLPEELPETQLSELTTYAMSFVERNGYHLLETLKDMNMTIYQDYKYVSGSTSLNTTPFEIYSAREGVCQDFANLFICLARLLSIPARYRMGYIYTGVNYENKIQSDASHAWVEIYLPYVGWRGFDPTNGCMVSQDHIRVACGRNYRDATPTSGTIFKGGGTETLSVDVQMKEVEAYLQPHG